jgi:hypothetical protein
MCSGVDFREILTQKRRKFSQSIDPSPDEVDLLPQRQNIK